MLKRRLSPVTPFAVWSQEYGLTNKDMQLLLGYSEARIKQLAGIVGPSMVKKKHDIDLVTLLALALIGKWRDAGLSVEQIHARISAVMPHYSAPLRVRAALIAYKMRLEPYDPTALPSGARREAEAAAAGKE
jgi:hypothetical protein